MDIRVISACYDARGRACLVRNTIRDLDQDEVRAGDHFGFAEQFLCEDDYEGPYVHFVEDDGLPWLFEKFFSKKSH